ncbi:hypothetical protein M409DRAFT_62155 [Zasmidium cellare ATCC 36951]|uniref:Fumarylacetoacetase-like C-terminal domain-containing protein n=1 Tax=Zasmidium cellare ATCC 36951 TaxID=1080233 RepID=A0A6A6D6J4_ZASCE|nr:uncharacterized protein M409DRAFT_62155 [Zasmidium cellare ATCC 36951]KAF2173950.1 hypothetical protein M409DRAFT_62155 [Zasmidium cellare ATCC 36951]
MKLPWKRLVRFVGVDGSSYYGEPDITNVENLVDLYRAGKLNAYPLDGDIFDGSATLSTHSIKVEKLLGPLEASQVPAVKGIGLNYVSHIKEAGRTTPTYPMFFIKGSKSVNDWGAPIPIPKVAQQEQCDYEGEMCFVIGREGKDIPKAEALNYVAGYMTGNDMSARTWQRNPKFAGPVPQFNFSKGFDKYAPLGPLLVSTELLGDASNLDLETRVNGELRQSSNTSDLLFDVPTLVEFLSQGTTLEKGTVVMTGTPRGVGMGMNPPVWLKHGDTVEVTVGGLGTLANSIVFE